MKQRAVMLNNTSGHVGVSCSSPWIFPNAWIPRARSNNLVGVSETLRSLHFCRLRDAIHKHAGRARVPTDTLCGKSSSRQPKEQLAYTSHVLQPNANLPKELMGSEIYPWVHPASPSSVFHCASDLATDKSSFDSELVFLSPVSKAIKLMTQSQK